MRDVNSHFDSRTPKTFEVSFKEYIAAYSSDSKLRKILDSGNFVYADRRLVIDNEKYVIRNERGEPCLTDYALKHEAECCLIFNENVYQEDTQYLFAQFFQRIGEKEQSGSRQYTNYERLLQREQEYRQLAEALRVAEDKLKKLLTADSSEAYQYLSHDEKALSHIAFYIDKHISEIDELSEKAHITAQEIVTAEQSFMCSPDVDVSDPNMEVFARSEELRKLRDNLIMNVAYKSENQKSFSELAWRQMKRCNCHYKDTFIERTLLSGKTFDRIKAGELEKPSVETVMAICIGLNLGILHGEPLLRSAGYDLEKSSILLHTIYHALLCSFHDKNIFECNGLLVSVGQPPINEKAYKEMLG